MKFHWTIEKCGYALRDERGYTWSAITTPGPRKGFNGLVFDTGLPSSGPYKSRQEAADWVIKTLLRLKPQLEGSTFGEVPETRRKVPACSG
jgi:hypothetical protein